MRVRKVARNGVISTVAGNGSRGDTGDGGPATAASFTIGIRAAVDANQSLHRGPGNVSRTRVDLNTGIISAYAGTGAQGFGGDGGQALAATFNNPTALALEATGNLYITDHSITASAASIPGRTSSPPLPATALPGIPATEARRRPPP